MNNRYKEEVKAIKKTVKNTEKLNPNKKETITSIIFMLKEIMVELLRIKAENQALKKRVEKMRQ